MNNTQIEKTAQDVMQVLDGMPYWNAILVLHRVEQLVANFLRVVVPEDEQSRHAEGNSALMSEVEYVAGKIAGGKKVAFHGSPSGIVVDD